MQVPQRWTTAWSFGLTFLLCLQLHYVKGFVLRSKINTCGEKEISKPFTEFYGRSHEEYHFSHDDENDLFLQFSFCTASRSGILAKLENFKSHQSLLSQVQNSRLIFSTKKDNNWIPECDLRFENIEVANGALHTVILRLTPESLDVQLFSKGLSVGSRRVPNFTCGSNKMNDVRHRLQIGGDSLHRDKDDQPHVLDGFTGCMRDIRVNGRLFHNSKDHFDVTPGCSAFQNSCTAVCPPPFEMIGGICRCPVETEMAANGTCLMSCACIECRNGGTCLSTSGQPYCHCRGGFSGKRCETPIDPCRDVLCHNGTCLKNATNFECRCNHGFKGEFCTEEDVCADITCKNNGICCQNRQSEPICLCPRNYTGKLCEIPKSEETRNYNDVYIAVGVLIICLIICSIFLRWFVFNKREILRKACKYIFSPGNSTNPSQQVTSPDPDRSGNASGGSEISQGNTSVQAEIPENPPNTNDSERGDHETDQINTHDQAERPENNPNGNDSTNRNHETSDRNDSTNRNHETSDRNDSTNRNHETSDRNGSTNRNHENIRDEVETLKNDLSKPIHAKAYVIWNI